MKQTIVSITAAALFLAANFALAQAQKTAPPEKTVRVKIYLLDAFESENLLENTAMQPLERTVGATAPLRFALEELLKGATDEENSQLFYSPIEGINLISARLKNKTAYVSFTRTATDEFDRLEARRLRLAVTKTARQFPSVKKVVICLDGVSNFDRGSAKTAPIKCR